MSVSPGGAEVPHIPMEECVTGGAASDRMGTLFGNYTLDENNYVVEGKWVPGIVLLYEQSQSASGSAESRV